MRTATTVCVLLIMLSACSADEIPRRIEQMDAHLALLEQEQGFSGAVLIARDGNVLFSKGYGYADQEQLQPNTPQTRFRIHWLTMPFTATAIMILQSDGLLDVQNPICLYIPNCPDYWQEITLHHLLTHTSGVSERIQPWDGLSDIPITGLQKIHQIRNEAPYFQPGEEFRYSFTFR